jgi:acyl carrier protein
MGTRTFDTGEIAGLVAGTFNLDPASILPETALFSGGLLDSFHLLELVAKLEALSGTKIKAGEVSLENLDSPARIVAFLTRKTSS